MLRRRQNDRAAESKLPEVLEGVDRSDIVGEIWPETMSRLPVRSNAKQPSTDNLGEKLRKAPQSIGKDAKEAGRALRTEGPTLENLETDYTPCGQEEIALKILEGLRRLNVKEESDHSLATLLTQIRREEIASNIQQTNVFTKKQDSRLSRSIPPPLEISSNSILQDLTSYSRDCRVNSIMLKEASSMLGQEWKDLGRDLGLDHGTLEQLEMDYQGHVKEAIYQMLNTWRNSSVYAATVSTLIQSLQFVGRDDIAQKILVMSSPTKFESSPAISSPHHLSPGLFSPSQLTLRQLQTNLRHQYKKFTMRGLPWMRNLPSLKKHFVQLQLICENGDFTNQSNSSFELDELFKPTCSFEEKEPSRILVEGKPGYGKTTLAIKLCYDFAHEKDYMSKFDVVLFFSLRNFVANLEEIIFNAAFISDKQRSHFCEIINNESIQTLLILDGYDELSSEHVEAVFELISGEILPHITLVVTSRPGRFTCNLELLSCSISHLSSDIGIDEKQVWDKITKVIGISEKGQVEFVEKHLSDLSLEERTLVKQQITEMKDMQVLTTELLTCPLFFLMIVLLLSEEIIATLQPLEKITDLYKGMTNFVIRRYLSKCNSSYVAPVDLFSETSPHFCIDLIRQLGKLSLKAIKNNCLVFSQTAVQGLDKRILDMGFLTHTVSGNGLHEVECCEPVHKSLIEFFAADFLQIEFRTDFSHRWVKNICDLRPAFAAHESLLFPFLIGLMEKDQSATFIALKPYQAEYSSWFESFIPTLREIETTDAVLSSLVDFLPFRWWTHWPWTGISSSNLPVEIMNEGLKAGRIKEITWWLSFPTCFHNDIKVHRLTLFVQNEVSPLKCSQFKRIECRTLLCEFKGSVKSLVNEWEEFLTLIKSINFQHISFKFNELSITSLLLPLIYEAVTNGDLIYANIQYIKCTLSDPESNLMDILIDIIQKERIRALSISLQFLPPSQQLQQFFISIANSSRVTSFRLYYYGSKSHPLRVDLAQLCNGGQKSYEWLLISNANVECTQQIQNHNSKIDLFELHGVHPMSCVANLLQSYRLGSYSGQCSILENPSPFFHESVTQLHIIICESFFQKELFSRLKQFHNLRVLTISLLPISIPTVSIHEWLIKSIDRLPFLKGIEIVVDNLPLAKEMVYGIAKYLEKLTSLEKQTLLFPSLVPRLHMPQLQYLSLRSLLSPNSNSPSSSDASKVREFVSVVLQLKHSLMQKALRQLHIVVKYDSFLRYMSKFKPKGFASIVEIFPLKDGFVVQHDCRGMTPDDPIRDRMIWDLGFLWSNRFSVSFSKENT